MVYSRTKFAAIILDLRSVCCCFALEHFTAVLKRTPHAVFWLAKANCLTFKRPSRRQSQFFGYVISSSILFFNRESYQSMSSFDLHVDLHFCGFLWYFMSIFNTCAMKISKRKKPEIVDISTKSRLFLLVAEAETNLRPPGFSHKASPCLPLRNIVALLAWCASQFSLFLHLSASPVSATGGGAALRPNELRSSFS